MRSLLSWLISTIALTWEVGEGPLKGPLSSTDANLLAPSRNSKLQQTASNSCALRSPDSLRLPPRWKSRRSIWGSFIAGNLLFAFHSCLACLFGWHLCVVSSGPAKQPSAHATYQCRPPPSTRQSHIHDLWWSQAIGPVVDKIRLWLRRPSSLLPPPDRPSD